MTRDIKKEMGDYLPRYYSDSRIVGNILDRESEEFTQLNADIQDVLNQFYVDTATWGLDRWERICGIPTLYKTSDGIYFVSPTMPADFGVEVTYARSYDERRAVIKSKLRGIGTVTVALVKSVAEAYANGEVDVIEIPSTYTVEIKFVGVNGIPPNIEDTKNALREIIPAHLGINYSFTYMTWDELDSYGFTWNSQDAMTMTWDDYEKYRQ